MKALSYPEISARLIRALPEAKIGCASEVASDWRGVTVTHDGAQEMAVLYRSDEQDEGDTWLVDKFSIDPSHDLCMVPDVMDFPTCYAAMGYVVGWYLMWDDAVSRRS